MHATAPQCGIGCQRAAHLCSSSVRADEGENRSPAPKLRPMVMIERRSRVHLRRGHNWVERHAATRQGQRQARGAVDIPLRTPRDVHVEPSPGSQLEEAIMSALKVATQRHLTLEL